MVDLSIEKIIQILFRQILAIMHIMSSLGAVSGGGGGSSKNDSFEVNDYGAFDASPDRKL